MKILDYLSEKFSDLTYENEAYRSLLINYDNFFENSGTGIDFNSSLLSQIQRISFELSNICNYSNCHKKCPASRVTQPRILPTGIIKKVLTELAEIQYAGVVAFHRYNEPFIDPRLISLIKMTKEICPASRILILTNGFYLTQEIADELERLDIWILAVSAYSNSEFKRLSAITLRNPYKVFFSRLDDRQDIYTAKPLDLASSCLAPFRDLTINVHGKLCLCCLDWQNRYEFGDVATQPLSEIVSSPYCLQIAKELCNAERKLDICRRCTMTR